MNDFKSKLPDFKELTSMAGKLFHDLKTSVCEIIDDYKQKRQEKPGEESKTPQDNVSQTQATTQRTKPTTASTAPKTTAPTSPVPPQTNTVETELSQTGQNAEYPSAEEMITNQMKPEQDKLARVKQDKTTKVNHSLDNDKKETF